MTRIAKIVLADEVNALVTGLDATTKTELDKHLTFFVPSAPFTPKYRLGVWDGKIHLFKDGWTYINLIDEDFVNILIKRGYEVDVIDQRNSQTIHFEDVQADWVNGIVLRDYQMAAVNITNQFSNGILLMATGAGKTNICAGITKVFAQHGKVVTVVPRIDLVASTSGAYINGGVPDVGVFYGQEKHIAQATVTTWQSLVAKPEILGGCVCLILDEAHLYSAKEMFNLLSGPAANIHHRYGFTGTMPKEKIAEKQLLAAIGPVIFSKSAYDLQLEGYLSSCHIHIMESQEVADPLNQMKSVGRPFVDHEQEFKWLLTDGDRLDWLAETIKTISSTGNTLVLMRLKATSDGLMQRLAGAIQVDGRVDSEDRTDIYGEINKGENAILLATKGVASTGIDITHIYNVVMIEAGKSFTEVIQMIGRGLRKGGAKHHVDVWDVSANTTYSKSHARERKKYYKENKYPFNVIKVPRLSAKEMFG